MKQEQMPKTATLSSIIKVTEHLWVLILPKI
jgi:hypothetical protein